CEQRRHGIRFNAANAGARIAVDGPGCLFLKWSASTGAAEMVMRMRSKIEKRLTQLVRERRATPAFGCGPVNEEDLHWILRAGLEAPSSYNMQPWRFVVVRDPDQRERLRLAAMDQEQVEQAPIVVVACGDTAGWKDDLEEVIRIAREHGYMDDGWAQRKRRNVTADLGSHPNMAMWVTKQTMIAAT